MKQKSSIMATLRPTHERGPYEKMLRKQSGQFLFPSLFRFVVVAVRKTHLSAFSSSRVFSCDSSQRSGRYSSASLPQIFSIR